MGSLDPKMLTFGHFKERDRDFASNNASSTTATAQGIDLLFCVAVSLMVHAKDACVQRPNSEYNHQKL